MRSSARLGKLPINDLLANLPKEIQFRDIMVLIEADQITRKAPKITNAVPAIA